jgi:hypothetical protein
VSSNWRRLDGIVGLRCPFVSSTGMHDMRKMAATAIVGKGAPSARGERGVILLVVLALLQLLSLIGIAFTVYAAHGGPP